MVLPIAGCSSRGSGGGGHPDGSVSSEGGPEGSAAGEGGSDGSVASEGGSEGGVAGDGGSDGGVAGDGGSEGGVASEGGIEGSAGDGGPGPVCGSATCASNEFCLASCASSVPQNPNYCTELPEGSTCPVEHPYMPVCLGGTGVDAGSAGCTVATFTYTCMPLTAGQTTYNCALLESQWLAASIVGGVATCCED